jgi:large repetitive protein
MVLARGLRGAALSKARTSCALPNRLRVVGSIAFAAVTVLLTSFASAQAQTATSLTISHNPGSSSSGQSVSFTVIISSATGMGPPTGTVTFSDGIGTIGSASATPGPDPGEAQATLTTTSLPVGNLTITATYGGDANFSGNSISTPFHVGGGGSQTSITSSQPSSAFGQSVIFTVTVSPLPPATGTPTGSVSLTVNGAPTTLMLNGGQATFTTSTLPPGDIPILATYNGDSNFGGSNASFTQSVRIAETLNLTSSANPSTLGQSVTFTATVPQDDGLTATGTVTFQLDG